MAVKLLRCRQLWGSSRIFEGSPPLRVVEDVLYLPFSLDRRWGLLKDGVQIAAQASMAPPEPPILPADLARSDEVFIYVGRLVTHYGHFVCDLLSWAWPLTAWTGPRPRLLCHADMPRAEWEKLDFIRVILERLGFGTDDLVAFDHPVRLRRVINGGASFGSGQYAYSVFGDLCRRIGEPIWRDCAIDSVDTPVYLSKSRLPSGIVRMVNEPELEDELARLGVDIVYPEQLPFVDQVRLLATRTMILGSAGSALHTSIFGPMGRRIIALHWETKLQAYFVLLDRLNRNQARYYIPNGAELALETGFGFGWVLPRPRAVAAELLERAAQFDVLDERDAAEDAARARLSNRVAKHASRLARRAIGTIRRRLGRLPSG